MEASLFQISSRNSHRQFECGREESVLQAGLRAGMPFRYKCTNGSCGECKTRLLKGKIHPLFDHDSVLSQQERGSGWFPACAYGPESDLEILPPLFGGGVEIPFQSIPCRVKRIERLQPELIRLTLRTPRSETFQFSAGQEVMLSHLSTRHRYPLASCPCNGGELQFHIPHQAEDPFSRLLFSSLRRGERVTVEGPRGQFMLDEESDRPQLFIAWESGFAPIHSLIQHLISLEMENPVQFYWISRGSPYLQNQAQAWSQVVDSYGYHWIEPQSDRVEELAVAVSEQLSATQVLSECDCYLAAPAPLLIALGEQLLLRGVGEDRLHGCPL